MLFDEKDLNIFDSIESRTYFTEIIQSYYSQNYRATIVMLYSFLIYDLFIKLQTMANEGDRKATQELGKINTMIVDDEKYSTVENEVINFYKVNSPLYFNKFVEDVEYLKNCRNKCAHLKVNDNSLYVPSDYHARMLICSMYDNIFSVKAPFIMDLFSIAQSDVENYSSSIAYISWEGLDEATTKAIKNKYLKRMTYDSIKKSYKTFIRLHFVSDNEDCEKNAYGLYAFTYALTDYIIKEGYTQIYKDETILDMFSRIEITIIKNSSPRRNSLISIMMQFPIVMDLIRKNDALFDYISNVVLSEPSRITTYRLFYPRNEKSIYKFFIENSSLHNPVYTDALYKSLKDCDEFNVDKFMELMVNAIPFYNGFYDADMFMNSFKSHIQEMSISSVERIIAIYRRNPQCTNRARHSTDILEVNRYIESYKNTHGAEDTSSTKI